MLMPTRSLSAMPRKCRFRTSKGSDFVLAVREAARLSHLPQRRLAGKPVFDDDGVDLTRARQC